MPNKSICISTIATLIALSLPGSAQAQMQQGARASFSGAYWCDPEPSPCPWPRQTMSIIQSGISVSDEASYVSTGLPWNLMGIIIPAQSVKWPDGANERSEPEQHR